MIISDLNYLESAEATVVGGYYFGPSSLTVNLQYLGIGVGLTSVTKISGNFAGAEADATAMGSNTFTEAITSTTVVQGVGSISNATSAAGTNGFQYCWP